MEKNLADILPPTDEYLICEWRDNGRILTRQSVRITSQMDEARFFHPQQADLQVTITRCRLIPEVTSIGSY